jgi:hypothetical protein
MDIIETRFSVHPASVAETLTIDLPLKRKDRHLHFSDGNPALSSPNYGLFSVNAAADKTTSL